MANWSLALRSSWLWGLQRWPTGPSSSKFLALEAANYPCRSKFPPWGLQWRPLDLVDPMGTFKLLLIKAGPSGGDPDPGAFWSRFKWLSSLESKSWVNFVEFKQPFSLKPSSWGGGASLDFSGPFGLNPDPRGIEYNFKRPASLHYRSLGDSVQN